AKIRDTACSLNALSNCFRCPIVNPSTFIIEVFYVSIYSGQGQSFDGSIFNASEIFSIVSSDIFLEPRSILPM
ncbi:hypothetical protein, partial [Paenibacillus sp. MMS18-CY102]|uniref:hypothetical protein n=1 Tax=Paenibacillus sp. MMS18-CY102 TaxID=2682849 RepID=UPI001F373FC6